VADAGTGEVLMEKKFYKADFDKVLTDPEYAEYCDDLLEKAMVRIMSSNENEDFDSESYEEVRAASLEIENVVIDPEG
jgi:hypothetical protein